MVINNPKDPLFYRRHENLVHVQVDIELIVVTGNRLTVGIVRCQQRVGTVLSGFPSMVIVERKSSLLHVESGVSPEQNLQSHQNIQ